MTVGATFAAVVGATCRCCGKQMIAKSDTEAAIREWHAEFGYDELGFVRCNACLALNAQAEQARGA
jgi:hypothetical protein